jgi:hypothetical protein
MSGQVPGRNAAGRLRDSDASDRTRLVIRAEQALLGAVMSDPVRQAPVLDLVRPDDMLRPYHGQVLAAMHRLRARGQAPAPVPVRAELAGDPDLPPRIALDGVRLVDLLEAAPRSGHASAYAGLVIEQHTRRQLLLAGSRMTQVAETGDLEAALGVTAQAGRDVQDCQARWDALPGSMRQELPQAAGHRTGKTEEAVWQLRAAGEEIARARQDAEDGNNVHLVKRLEAIVQHVTQAAATSNPATRRGSRAPDETRPTGKSAEAVGRQFLRDLAAGPGQIPEVRSWLDPGHFARPIHGQLYSLICDMHAAGKTIDPVTIAWQAARRDITIDATDLEGGTVPFAVSGAREVHRHGLLARVSQAGRDICAEAGDPRVPPRVIFQDSSRRLRNLERELDPEPGKQVRSGGKCQPAAQTAALPPPALAHLSWQPRSRESSIAAEPA